MLSSQEALTQLKVKVETGLSTSEADQRKLRYGPNLLRQEKKEPLWKIFIEHIREPMLLLLLGVGVLYFFFGTLRDTITIFAVVLLIVSIEIFNEQRAEKAIASLHKLAEQRVPVKRNGHIMEILCEDVVPGDILLLEAGEKVAADARLIESYGLSVNESLLTGESSTVCKEADAVLGESTPLAERNNLVFAGTTITGGRGLASAIATGMDTELGHIADLTHQVKETETPLQKVMAELSRWMVWLALGFSVVIPFLGWLVVHLSFSQMLLTGLSLFFASVPEELPVIIAMVLALGGYHLSKQNAIVKRLRAIEALGATTVIATDKTGTLTENQITV